MSDNKADRTKEKDFLTRLFTNTGRKSAAYVEAAPSEEQIRQAAQAQAQHFLREPK